MWGPVWTQYLPTETGETGFRKRHYDERLGWVGGPIPRAGVRTELIDHLTREVSKTANRSHGQPVDVADRFQVQPVAELRRR